MYWNMSYLVILLRIKPTIYFHNRIVPISNIYWYRIVYILLLYVHIISDQMARLNNYCVHAYFQI